MTSSSVEWLMPKILELSLQLSLSRISQRTCELEILKLFQQAKEMEEDYKYEAYKEGLFNGITAYVTNDEKLSLEELHNKALNKKKEL